MKYLNILIKETDLTHFEDAFEEYGTIIVSGVKGFERLSANILDLAFERWQVKLIPYDTTNINSLQKLMLDKQAELGYTILQIRVDKLNKLTPNPECNENIEIQIDNICISNQLTNLHNPNNINIFMKQSLGFGTGKHETTFLCLKLLSQLHKAEKLQKILDLGTGSGILAIASAKLSQKQVLAVDLDKLALSTAEEFINANQVENLIKTLFSNGFQNIPKQQFSLIIANILLNPLLAMADDFYNYTSKEGFLILSGILNSQSSILKKTFTKWRVITELERNGWSALLLQKY